MSKHNDLYAESSVGSDMIRHARHQVTAIKNAGKVRTLKNGDFNDKEIENILKDLNETHKTKNFILAGIDQNE